MSGIIQLNYGRQRGGPATRGVHRLAASVLIAGFLGVAGCKDDENEYNKKPAGDSPPAAYQPGADNKSAEPAAPKPAPAAEPKPAAQPPTAAKPQPAPSETSTPPADNDTPAPKESGDESGKTEQSAPTPPPAEDGSTFKAPGLVFTVPAGWKASPPSNKMRVGEFALPGEDGPAELIVFHFGVQGAGTLQANIDRWIDQFKPEDPSGTVKSDVQTEEANGLKLTFVRAWGSYAPSPMGGMVPATAAQTGQALFGVVLEGGPQGDVFIKATGPEATIESHAEEIKAFAKSARANQ